MSIPSVFTIFFFFEWWCCSFALPDVVCNPSIALMTGTCPYIPRWLTESLITYRARASVWWYALVAICCDDPPSLCSLVPPFVRHPIWRKCPLPLTLLSLRTYISNIINTRNIIIKEKSTCIDPDAFDGKDLNRRLIALNVSEELSAALVPGIWWYRINERRFMIYYIQSIELKTCHLME